ncbi:uncharacterized protein LOC130635912 [Hydractinia symbiolongicarpus]|uniref:uncharacterized protein LOC130635912 n=1 Tax=Hydractinia symbiolongicarpus TaxID=13093 RepID=UPI00254DD556|nr:uncharacterized protein LOC130635912 [Hydractinia symbiolongicarpus]
MKLPNQINVNNEKAEVEICGHPKPEVNFYIDKGKRLPGACKLTDERLKKYKCEVELTDLNCGEMLYLEGRGYDTMKLTSSSLLIANYTPQNVSYKADSNGCYTVTWSIYHLGIKCVKMYELKALLDDESLLKNTTILTTLNNNFMCYPSILYVKVRTVSIWNAKSNWVMQEINAERVAQRKDNNLKVIIPVIFAFVLVAFIVLLMKRKKFCKRNFVNKHQLPWQNAEDGNDDGYEMTGETSSHYADLNPQFITPSVYAELTNNTTAEAASSNYAEPNVQAIKPRLYADLTTKC